MPRNDVIHNMSGYASVQGHDKSIIGNKYYRQKDTFYTGRKYSPSCIKYLNTFRYTGE